MRHDRETVMLGERVGYGGSKNIYDIGNGYVAALPNGQSREVWKRMVEEEVSMAKRVRAAGLRSQQYERVTLIIEGEPEPILAIKMPSFSTLLNKGIQVRDAKRPRTKYIPERRKEIPVNTGYGSSRIFDSQEKVSSPDHWRRIFRDITPDAIQYLAGGFAFSSDAFNLCIENSDTTPAHDATNASLFTERNQTLRLFFYDFSSKTEAISGASLHEFISDDGNICEERIQSQTEFLVIRIIGTIMTAATTLELKEIVDSVDMFCLMCLHEIAKPALDKVIPEIQAEIVFGVKNRLKVEMESTPTTMKDFATKQEFWKQEQKSREAPGQPTSKCNLEK